MLYYVCESIVYFDLDPRDVSHPEFFDRMQIGTFNVYIQHNYRLTKSLNLRLKRERATHRIYTVTAKPPFLTCYQQ